MYLGLDLGTSGLKGLLVDGAGDIITSASSHYDVCVPENGWAEQDPDDWLGACEDVIVQLKQSFPSQMDALKAISFSGHMHGAVCVSQAGEVLRPCILWNDMRSAKQAKSLDEMPIFRQTCGNIVFPGFTAPKLVWMSDEEPDLFAQIHKVLLPKDYLTYWLTGRFVTDCSDASGTAWLDVGKRSWSQELIHACGLKIEQMPDLVEGTQVVGTVRADLANHLGLPQDVQIVAGGADNAVAACGAGTVQAGQGFVSLGTSGVVLVASDSYSASPETAVHSFCQSLPDKWYQMGVMLSATNSLNWLASIVNKEPVELAKSLQENTPIGPSDISFLPYLTGERTPHNDANARGSFFGLSIEHSEADLTQAVMEGVGFGLKDCLQAIEATGSSVSSLLAIGGGSNSGYWQQLLADILQIELYIPQKGDFGAALGAARLAIIGSEKDSGTSNSDASDVIAMPKIEHVIEPQRHLADAYNEAHENYRNLYVATKNLKRKK